MKIKKRRFSFSSTQTIIIGFLALILVGAALLSLPVSAKNGGYTSFTDALFTSVSATCVTGLAVVDTFSHWSYFGQAIILILIQIGGLGFMTVAVMLSIILRRSISPRERFITAQSMNVLTFDGIIRFVKMILTGTFIFEFFGACILAVRFIPLFGLKDGIVKSIFHSVAAFCNAGFDLMGSYSGQYSSLSAFRADPVINITIMILVICGGIGFVVWRDLYNRLQKKKRISLYSKIVLITSALLIAFGFLFFLIAEWNNTAIYESASASEKIYASLFQSVSMRTAGFTTVDMAQASGGSKLVSCLLMFIGGSSGSTAGGIKTVTFAILVIAILQSAGGRITFNIGGRKISNGHVHRALAIAGCGIFIVLLTGILLSFTQDCSVTQAMYEAFSAFGTVGVSLGLTPSLNVFGKYLLMIVMFLGRVGILTFTFAILLRQTQTESVISYPEENNIMIG